MSENIKNNDEQANDEFLKGLYDPSSDIKETENASEKKPETVSPKEEEPKKEVSEEEKFEESISNMQDKPVEKKEEPLVAVEPVETPKEEVKTEEKPKPKAKKKKSTIEVVSSEEFTKSKEEKENPKPKVDNKIDIDDDIEKRINEGNETIVNGDFINQKEEIEDSILNESIDSYIHKNYDTDDDSSDKKDNKPKEIEIVSGKNEEESEKIVENVKERMSHEDKLKESNIYGGDGKVSAFKIRRSHISKILNGVKISDTSSIDPIDISNRSDLDKSEMYVKTVIPTLNPCYSVVPLVISGVVITMTAFSWPNIRDICLIEEKLDDLDPTDEDYIYKKNQLFIEKRKKQLDLFYEHIYSISGFPVKPSKEEFYGKIMKWPDFQQLFFAAYSATFQKSYDFILTCPRCGLEQTRAVNPKNLCFMLNKNINIDSFNYYLQKGAAVATNDDSIAVYKEFQKEKIVDKSNNVYRTIKPLSDSAMICTLKVPTVNEAMEMIEQIAETFRDKELEHTDEDGTTIAIDSSFGVNDVKDLKELKRYLYINSLLIAEPNQISEDKIKVGYIEFKAKDTIINTITRLSVVDYKEFISDPNLNAITTISGIRHQFDAKICDNPNCKQEMGLMAIEPETLFFTIAKQELPE